mgnify:FL=1
MKALIEGARSIGLTLSPKEIEAFRIYQRELAEWNARFNLTAIHGEDQVQIRHFLDSLSCLLAMGLDKDVSAVPRGDAGKLIPKSVRAINLKAIDIGSGPGFPGIPLRIVCPHLKLTLLEATAKKVTFLQHIVTLLGLKDVHIIHDRAEVIGHHPEHREQYDLALARAVAELPVLAEYALPLCCLGGRVIAQKGQDVQLEAMNAQRAIQVLGGALRYLLDVELPGLAEPRSLVVISKVARTPEMYPRRPGIPKKRPL